MISIALIAPNFHRVDLELARFINSNIEHVKKNFSRINHCIEFDDGTIIRGHTKNDCPSVVKCYKYNQIFVTSDLAQDTVLEELYHDIHTRSYIPEDYIIQVLDI